jgi:hypothetical protein
MKAKTGTRVRTPRASPATTSTVSTSRVPDTSSFIDLGFEPDLEAPDPTLPVGFQAIFDREIAVLIDSGTPPSRILRARILDSLAGDEIRVELTDHYDVHLYLISSVTGKDYVTFQKDHRLRVEFGGFSNSIKGLFTTSVEQPSTLQLRFKPPSDGVATLSFFQKLTLRAVTIFDLDFKQADDAFVADYVQKKFGAVKVDLEERTREFEALLSKIEEKNPSLAKVVRQEVEKQTQKLCESK